MADYLLDTNMISYWYHQRPNVISRIKEVRTPDPQTGYISRLFASVVTLGEIHYGHRVAPAPNPKAQAAFFAFIKDKLLEPLDIEKHVVEPYAELRAWLFDHCSPKVRRTKAKRTEELVYPTTARDLGIQENDLWIAAQAVTHNLVLVTHDGLGHLREALGAVFPQLRIEDWTLKP